MLRVETEVRYYTQEYIQNNTKQTKKNLQKKLALFWFRERGKNSGIGFNTTLGPKK